MQQAIRLSALVPLGQTGGTLLRKPCAAMDLFVVLQS
jgi:hypothetical protein